MFKKLIIGLFVIIFTLALIDQFLNKNFEVKRTIVVKSDFQSLDFYIKDLKQWEKWNPWKDHDPSIEVQLSPKTNGVGAMQTWTSKEGNGKLQFTKVLDHGIEYDVWIQEGADKSNASIHYEKIDDKTKVTWHMKGQMNFTFGGYLALGMDGMVGPMFQDGLNKLKKLIEKK